MYNLFPIIKENSIIYNKYDLNDIIHTFLLMMVTHLSLYLINKIFLKTIIINDKISWFILHIVCNLYAVCRDIPVLLLLTNDPIGTILCQKTTIIIDSRLIIMASHIYHNIFFRLNNQDKFHHFAFVYFGTFCIHFVDTGYILSIYYLFSSGVPGAIIYFVTVLEHFIIITKKNRLIISSFINTWLRSIGLIFCGSLYIIRFLCFDKFLPDWICLGIVLFCTFFNGQYYTNQVVRAEQIFMTEYEKEKKLY